MKEIGLDELKVLQMDVMSAVHRFCEANHLRYSLACGSLLGAARHKGYIPWDDDIDIYLLREDYDKMIKLFPDLWEGRYKFFTLERDTIWGLPFGKVCDTKTIVKEGVNHIYELGVNIDVFPIDDVPEEEAKWRRYDKFRRKCFELYVRRVDCPEILNFHNGKSFARNVLATIVKMTVSVFSVHFLACCFQKVAKHYDKTDSSKVFECAQGIFQKHPFPKSLFNHRILMPFEDREYMCFADFDSYLTNGFGNWRQLPPKEKQVSHHDFKAWWKD
ncbi:LicD family protein [Prevotella sp. LCP21S3_D2]|uniref:LicD family protein n=1 Tax=Prevotella sp. LCP21S3_D2 TaxID=3438800 RepID=UPI003F976FB3